MKVVHWIGGLEAVIILGLARWRCLSHLLGEEAAHGVVAPVDEPIRVEVVLHLSLLLLLVLYLLVELTDLLLCLFHLRHLSRHAILSAATARLVGVTLCGAVVV